VKWQRRGNRAPGAQATPRQPVKQRPPTKYTAQNPTRPIPLSRQGTDSGNRKRRQDPASARLRPTPTDKSFCFFFQKEVFDFFCSFFKKRTKKLLSV
jgi:hypothetical protein